MAFRSCLRSCWLIFADLRMDSRHRSIHDAGKPPPFFPL
jgi:hypothetical protein